MNWQPMETAPRDGRTVLLWYKTDIGEGPMTGEWIGDWWNTGGPASEDAEFSHWCEIEPPRD